MNKKKSILESNVLYTIIAIIAGFLIGAIFLMIAGISPAVAYGKLFSSIFSKPKYLVWTLVYASPLIFTGLSVAFSFRTGVFNIGAEGQFVIGGLVACVLGIVLDLPPVIHAIVCLVAAAAGRMYLVPDRRCAESKKRNSRGIYPLSCLTGLPSISPTMW